MKWPKFCGQGLFLALALGASGSLADILYVADSTSGNVYQFDTVIGAGSRTLVAGSAGLNARCIAVDGSGNLFLGNAGDGVTDFGDIYEITTNGTVKQIATGLNYPDALVVDSQGDLFEAEELNPAVSASFYLNEFINTGGTLSPTPVAFGGGLAGPGFLAFDGSGDLFEADAYSDNIHEFINYPNGLSATASPTPFDNNNFSSLAPLAFDANGDLLVGGSWGVNGPAGYGINVYSNTAGVLSSTPSAFYATPDPAYGIAIDSKGNVFYADDYFGTIQELTNNAGTLSTIPTDFESFANTFAVGLAIFHPTPTPPAPPQLLYVAANQSIYAYSPALGSASQTTIASGLPFEPVAMAVDPSGNVFISDGISTIYEVPTNGVPVLLSPDLNGPMALACDTNGNLFEADYYTASIYEFTNVSGSVTTTPGLFASDGSFSALAFDNSGDLIASWGGAVNFVEYPQTGGVLSSTESYLPAGENGIAGSLAFDQYGDLVSGFPTGDSYTPAGDGIFENINNNSAAWYNGGVLAYTATAVATENVAGLVCDTNGNLFVVDGDSGNVFEYPNNAGTISPSPTLFIGGLGATCVAMNTRVHTPSVPATHNLYVSGGNGGSASPGGVIYGYNTTNGAMTRITLDAPDFPAGVAFDTNGNLFVGTSYDVAEYVNNSGTVASEPVNLSLFVDQATVGEGVAFDQAGDMWVSDEANSDTYHFVYSGTVGIWNGAYGPGPWLPGAGSSLAFAGPTEQCAQIRGNLFANVDGVIEEYANMSGQIGTQTETTFGGINNYGATSLAFDGTGNLFVGYYGHDNSGNYGGFIYEFIASPGALSTTPTLFASGLGIVTGLAFDASGNLFEAEYGNSTNNGLINEFLNTPGGLSSTPVLFASGLETPVGMAIYVPTPPPTAGMATKLAFTTEPPASTQAGATMAPFAVQVEDAFGTAVAQSGVMVKVSGPGGLSGNIAFTDATGLAIFDNTSITLAGTGLAFSAFTSGLSDAESTSFAITAAAAGTLAFTTEPAASTQAGVTMANVVVQIQDQYGNLVAQSGTAIMLGGVTLASGTTSQNTDAGGRATFNDLVIDTAGSGLIFTATYTGLLTPKASTPFAITAAGPSKLAFTTEPAASTQAGATMAAMVVQVEDLYGNALSQNSIGVLPVTLSGPAGLGLSGATASSGALGQAVFASTSITVAGEDLTLTAKSSGLTSATSTQFNIVPAEATKLAFLKEPAASTMAGMTMANVVVEIEDPYGNFVSQTGTPITLSGVPLASGAGPVNTGAGGGVSFNDLVIDQAGTGLVFTASAGVLTGMSTPFAITPAAPSQLVFTVEPAVNTLAGATMAPVTVQIEDPYFNHIAQGGTAIMLGGVTLASGTNPKNTDGAGAAVFNNLVIDKAGAGLAFTAASTGLTTGTSTPFGIQHLGTSKLAFTTEPAASTEVGLTMSPMVVQLEDLYSNAVPLGGVNVTLSGPSGLTGTAASTDLNGHAVFSGTSIANTGVGLTLTAGTLGITTASTPFDITPPPLILAPQPPPAKGMFQFTFSHSDPHAIFDVLFNTNPALPLKDWIVIGTASNVSSGVFQFTDTQATNSVGYYTILQQ